MENAAYRVIEILDKHSVLINYGSNDGAKKGEEIRVIAKGPEVKDPVTDELLGTLDKVKEELTIVTAYERFSLCKKIEVSTRNILINPLTQFQHTTTEIVELKIDEKDASNRKLPKDTTIKVGDIIEIL